MNISEVELYSEVIACLKQTLHEGQKESNVDIEMMLENLQRCCEIVQKLISTEDNILYVASLSCLQSNLTYQCAVLQKKIQQLNAPHYCMKPADVCIADGFASSKGSQKNSQDGYDDEQRRLRISAIENTIVKNKKMSFKHIAGLTDAKQALTEAIIMPLHFPHLFTGARKPWKRILLYGPPGTGKSRIALGVASELSSTFYSVSSADLVSSFFGESEKLVKELFTHAAKQPGRSVIFIDEIDSVCRRRSVHEEEHSRRIKTELLKQMEGADDLDISDKIFLLCATNCPWELDPAFLRRFQKRIYIPLPDRAARLLLISLHSDNLLELSGADWEILANKTEGYSGSDLASVTLGALFEPIRDLQNSHFWRQSTDGKWTPCDKSHLHAQKASISNLPPDKIVPRQVMLDDFLRSLQTHRCTITTADLQKFQEFATSFGEA